MPKSKKWTEEQNQKLLEEIKDFDHDENGNLLLHNSYVTYLNKRFGKKLSARGWGVLLSRFQEEPDKETPVTKKTSGKKKSKKPVKTCCDKCGGTSAITVHSKTRCARCIEGMFDFYSAEIVKCKERCSEQEKEISNLVEKLAERDRINLFWAKQTRLWSRKHNLLEQVNKESDEQLLLYNEEMIVRVDENEKLKKEIKSLKGKNGDETNGK